MSHIHSDLKRIAESLTVWPKWAEKVQLLRKDGSSFLSFVEAGSPLESGLPFFFESDVIMARQAIGLDDRFSALTDNTETPEEKEELDRIEARQGAKHSKYHREIKPGVWVDVYDVLHAWAVQNPALQHLIKKALAPGSRGHKDTETDLREILASAERAIQLEGFE